MGKMGVGVKNTLYVWRGLFLFVMIGVGCSSKVYY